MPLVRSEKAMHYNICKPAVIFALVLAVASGLQPFTKGNILLLKQIPTITQGPCVGGSLVEVTVDGEIVQEFLLPSNSSEPNVCLLWDSDYYGRLTLANDGFRAVLPCCNYLDDPSTGSKRVVLNFGLIYGSGHFETTAPLFADNHDLAAVPPIHAIVDGNEIWYTLQGTIWYTAFNKNDSVVVFNKDGFALRSYNGNLFTSGSNTLGSGLAQVGTGLPREFTEQVRHIVLGAVVVGDMQFANGRWSVCGNPNGFSLWKDDATFLTSNANIPKITQHVVLPELGKAIVAGYTTGSDIPAIYTMNMTEGENNQVFFGQLTLFLDTENGEFHYSPSMAPEDSCVNQIKDLDETDVDCGGWRCSKCTDDKPCVLDRDCTSGFCIDNICVTPVPMAPPTTPPVAAPTATAIPAIEPAADAPVNSEPIGDTPDGSIGVRPRALIPTAKVSSAEVVNTFAGLVLGLILLGCTAV